MATIIYISLLLVGMLGAIFTSVQLFGRKSQKFYYVQILVGCVTILIIILFCVGKGHVKTSLALLAIEAKFDKFATIEVPQFHYNGEYTTTSYSPEQKSRLDAILQERDRILQERGASVLGRWYIAYPNWGQVGYPSTTCLYLAPPW